ncbi:MAG: hypothetical protein GXP31_14085 [Kiritimatiellaeota bacterium]|nr:hypothetical protein [Kiritimatiellota bacterium]
MKRLLFLSAIAASFLSWTPVGSASGTASFDIRLSPAPTNPEQPMMGDRLRFHSVIRNTGPKPVEGLTTWINLLEVDPGNEQPMDLEDWSAHKAVTRAELPPGKTLESEWLMRLIKRGVYRVVICVASRNRRRVFTSPTVEFRVTQKPVVQSRRILPVAFGVPLMIGLIMLLRRFCPYRVSETTDTLLMLCVAFFFFLMSRRSGAHPLGG